MARRNQYKPKRNSKQKLPYKRNKKSFQEKELLKLLESEVLYSASYKGTSSYSIKGSNLLEKIKRFREERDSQLNQIIDYNIISVNELRDWWMTCIDKKVARCSICGELICGHKSHNLDHVFPKSLGGQKNGNNGMIAHRKCNTLKANYTPEVWEQVGLLLLYKEGISVNLEKCLYEYKRIKTNER